jgi:hypothetical protein
MAGSIASAAAHSAEFARKVNLLPSTSAVSLRRVLSATQVMRLLEAAGPFELASAA